MIQKKLLEIQKAVRGLDRDATGYGYKYVSGDKLLSFLRPKMDELGVVLATEVLNVETKEIRSRAWSSKARAEVDQFNLLYILSMRMTWIDCEEGDTLALEWKAAGENGLDKGYGSALTYGERYFLMKFFHIATDEDDVDAKPGPEDNVDAKPARIPRSKKTSQAPSQNQAPPAVPKEVDEELYQKMVKCAAEGLKTRKGEDCREYFRRYTGADDERMKKFDVDVDAYRQAELEKVNVGEIKQDEAI